MSPPGSFTGSGTRLGAALGALAVSVGLGACGGAGGTSTGAAATKASAPHAAPQAEVRGLRSTSCPAPNLVVHAETYSRAETRAALHGAFMIRGHRRHLVAPVDWAQDPYQSRAFRSVLASLKWTGILLSAYRHGNLRALAEARDLALDWIRHNPRSDPPSDKSWFNKVIGDRAPFLAYIARASSCEGLLSRRQAATFVGSLAEHGRVLASPKNYVQSNHGLFMDYGLVALAKEAPYLRSASRWERFAPRRFERTLLGRVYPDEGFWLENSSSYHLAARTLTHKFVHLAGGAVPASLARLAHRMDEVGGWLTEPDGRRVLLGDSNLKDTPHEILALSARDEGLLWLPRSGLAVVKRPSPDPSFLLFGATFHNATHNQADALTFDLYANGERVTSDSGLYDKDPDPYQRFSRSSLSHSVMTIDGKSFPIAGGKRYGSGLRAVGHGDGWYAMEGVNPLATLQGVTHDRLLLYKPGQALLVVDFARSGGRHTYARYFQLGPNLHVARRAQTLEIRNAHGFVARLSSSGTEPSRLRLVKGRRHPLGGFIFERYRRAVPRTTARYTSRGRDVDEVATFALDAGAPIRAGLRPGSSPDEAALALRAPGRGSEVINVSRRGSRLRIVRHGANL